MKMGSRILTMSSAKHFAPVLWKEVHHQIQLLPTAESSACESLKRKFFLRQFIEEMPDSEERGLVRGLAFETKASQTSLTDETLRILDRSYAMLHETLVRQGAGLAVYTDSIWTAAELRDGVEAIPYHTILFGTAQSLSFDI